jgi:oxalate decarboxylase/phosphoglucose isomerase-like protein (cupin superfamily)
MNDDSRYGQKPQSRYAVISSEQPVVDQGDPHDAKWMEAGGDARDRGRMVELVSKSLTGSERLMVGLGWLDPGDIHLLHHHPHADEWYYVIHGSALFTVGGDSIRGTPGTAMFIPAGVPHRIVNDGPETLHIAWGFDQPELVQAGIIWDE